MGTKYNISTKGQTTALFTPLIVDLSECEYVTPELKLLVLCHRLYWH